MCLTPAGLQSMASFDEVLRVHKQMVRCGSVHMVSCVHFKGALGFLANKVNLVLVIFSP